VEGKTKLARLQAQYRSIQGRSDLPDLTVEQILTWADAHQESTGRRPTQLSGPVTGAPGEKWSGIQVALYHGLRGLPGGMTLEQLLDLHRPRRQRLLSLDQILTWADAHRKATGKWPTVRSGRVAGVPGEFWDNIHRCLCRGHRGLPRGLSLADVLDQARPHGPGSRLEIPSSLAPARLGPSG
jgi:hypothetical protein